MRTWCLRSTILTRSGRGCWPESQNGPVCAHTTSNSSNSTRLARLCRGGCGRPLSCQGILDSCRLRSRCKSALGQSTTSSPPNDPETMTQQQVAAFAPLRLHFAPLRETVAPIGFSQRRQGLAKTRRFRPWNIRLSVPQDSILGSQGRTFSALSGLPRKRFGLMSCTRFRIRFEK